MQSAIPLILCGKTPTIAKGVVDGLKPEYEVLHVIFSVATGTTQIPSLLRGEGLPPNSSDTEMLGSQDFTKIPAAVLCGAGYGPGDVEQMRDACKDSKVPWLTPDLSVPRPPLGPEYGRHMLERAREKMRILEEEKKLQADGVYLY